MCSLINITYMYKYLFIKLRYPFIIRKYNLTEFVVVIFRKYIFNKLLHSFSIMSLKTRDSVEVKVLETRLTEAERRLKLLHNEIKDIKKQLTLIQPTQKRNFSTSPSLEYEVDNVSSNIEKKQRLNLPLEGDYCVVYTDGACENNGRANAKAGIGVWFADGHPCNASKPLTGKATNNRAEIHACVTAIKIAHENGVEKLRIKTDSQFVINSITQWIHKWKKNNWKVTTGNDVKNKEDFIILDNACKLMQDIKWEHVDGHKGLHGNEEADKLAREGAARYIP